MSTALYVPGIQETDPKKQNRSLQVIGAQAAKNTDNITVLQARGTPASWTRTVFTSGSGTYTTPTGAKALRVRIVGGGAGGQGNSTNGLINTSPVPTAGGNTTFGSLAANGGSVLLSGNYPIPPGGTASGGDINIQGGYGQGGQQALSTAQLVGGTGGGSVFGSGGGSQIGASGGSAVSPGAGGGGAPSFTSANSVSGAGGGAGGYCEKLIVNPAATYSYAVGAGGSGGVGANYNGASGAGGIIIIDEYY